MQTPSDNAAERPFLILVANIQDHGENVLWNPHYTEPLPLRASQMGRLIPVDSIDYPSAVPKISHCVTDPACLGKRLPGVAFARDVKGLQEVFPRLRVLRRWMHDGGEWMKRMGFAMLLLSTFCWAQASDGFEPASTNVWGAAYPRVDAGGRAEFRVKAPNAAKVQVNFWGAAKLDMVQQPDGFWTATSEPLVPGFHYYTLSIDGAEFSDQASHTVLRGCTRPWIRQKSNMSFTNRPELHTNGKRGAGTLRILRPDCFNNWLASTGTISV